MDQPTVTDNASSPTASAPPDVPQLTDDLIKSHPLYKELEEKHAAARKGMDDANIKLKEVKVDKPEGKQLEYVTKDDLWERDNKRKIALAGDEFNSLKEQGIKPDLALELALARKGYATPEAVSDALRQAESSSASSVVDRSGPVDRRSEEARRVGQKMGLTDEDYAKYGERAARMLTRVDA